MAVLTAPARHRTGTPRRGGQLRRHEARAGLLFVLPFLVLFVTMFLAPLVYSAYLSTFRQQLVGGSAFVGLANYARALGDQAFLTGLLRVATVLFVQVPILLALAIVFALALDSARVYFGRFVRLAIFVPYAVPAVIAALMWGYLYGPDFGPFAQLARGLGLPEPQFLSESWMLGSIMNVLTWSYVGYNMVILIAALRSIPTELYEAARVDGAGEFRIAWSIKLPALRPAIILITIFSVIGSFQLFNEPQIFSTLAPAVIGSAYTPNLYAYNLAFVNRELNYAAAISFLLGIIIMIVSYVFQLSTRDKGARR